MCVSHSLIFSFVEEGVHKQVLVGEGMDVLEVAVGEVDMLVVIAPAVVVHGGFERCSQRSYYKISHRVDSDDHIGYNRFSQHSYSYLRNYRHNH
jgi:hypothetical protein